MSFIGEWAKPRTMEMVLVDLVNAQAITPPRPEIDSIWVAKDGRRVRTAFKAIITAP